MPRGLIVIQSLGWVGQGGGGKVCCLRQWGVCDGVGAFRLFLGGIFWGNNQFLLAGEQRLPCVWVNLPMVCANDSRGLMHFRSFSRAVMSEACLLSFL